MQSYPNANLDTSFFAVLVKRRLGNNRQVMSLDEREQPDNRAAIIREIRNGEYHRVVAVIEFNPVEAWSRDISSEIAQAVLDGHHGDDTWSDCALNFVESSLPGVFIRRAA